ncbi:PAS fold family [Coleofasciculus chthonoplastes PCC 7420]|uniref:histidine kinase n=1 Tax=Coleofasciculus chthonoplastes PCC 7420 TaxID=118168 RepID=B4VT51_9CYAN|nr:PAS domain S-box protein [Coleofasciculus chthonoplastes]EDX74842.1 PAS fold family [Coleofasciculus chthonoplastes PCC 7420]
MYSHSDSHSLSLFQALFNQALDAMAIADDQGQYVEVNPAACRLFGLSREELLGCRISDFTDLEFDFQEAWRIFLEQGQVKGEFRLRRRDGTIRETEYAATANVIPHRHLSILRDITDRKQVEAELRQSEERLNLALYAAQMGIWDWNLLTNQIRWSEHHEVLFGLTPGTYDGTYKTFEACIHPDDREAVKQAANRSQLEQHEYDHEFRVVWSDGSIHWIEGKGKFIYDQTGQAVRMLGTVIDISDRKQAETQIYRLNAELEQRVIERTQELQRTNDNLNHEIQERQRAEAAVHLQAQQERLISAIAQQIRQSLDLNQILNTTVTQVQQLLACDQVVIYQTHDDGTGNLVAQALASDGSVPQEHSLPELIFPPACHQFYCSGGIHTIADVKQDDIVPCLADTVRRFGVKSKLVMPILENETLWGLLIAHHYTTIRQWQPWEAELLCSLTTQVTIAIQQAELYSQLQAELRERQHIQQERDRLFNLSVDILGIVNFEGYFIDVNPAFEKILGISSDAIKAQPFIEWVHPEDREATQAQMRKLASGITIKSFENRYCSQDGSYQWFSWTAVPFVQERLVYVVAHDITERKQAEQALQESEQRFRTVADFTYDWEYWRDPDGSFIYVSPSCQRITGYQAEEFLNDPSLLEAIIHPDDRQRMTKHIREQLDNPHVYSTDFRLITRTGSIRWIAHACQPVYSKDRRWLGQRASNRDISDRKQTEEALYYREQQFRALVENSPDIVARFDHQLRHLYVNPAIEQVAKCSAQTFIGKTNEELGMPPDKAQFWDEALRSVFTTGQEQLIEFDFPTSKGMKFFHSRIVPELNADGTIRSVLSVTRDITAHKEIEVALQQAKDAAEVANRAKSEFLATMSHELRTPLNGILGYTKLLQNDTNLTETQRESLNIIYHCGEHLLTLINDILDFSKIESQKLELDPSEFHLPTFLSSISSLFRLRATQKEIDFTYKLLSPLPQNVIADEKRLRQVLINLLSNAVKFTDQGSVTFKVGYVEDVETCHGASCHGASCHGASQCVGASLTDNVTQETANVTKPARLKERDILSQSPITKIRFQVEDTGIGIDPQQLSEIFLPFHQVSDRTHAVEGTGLGLAISQKLVQLMDSTIQVSSILGQGSVFWFDLELSDVSGGQASESLCDRRLIGVKGQQQTLLIVDDNAINRSFLRELLQPFNLNIVEAVDGQDCLQKAVEIQPDLILMDLIMPGLDGLTATRRLRQLPQLAKTVIIAISANVFEMTQQESLTAGCQDFLSKPVPIQQLLELLMVHLGVEGIYEKPRNLTTGELETNTKPLVSPPASELAILSELLAMGDIQGMIDQAQHWQDVNSQWIPFATQIHHLARGFQLKKIEQIINQYTF